MSLICITEKVTDRFHECFKLSKVCVGLAQKCGGGGPGLPVEPPLPITNVQPLRFWASGQENLLVRKILLLDFPSSV